MPTLWNDADRQALLARLSRLTPAHERRWGSMTASQMMAHLNDAFGLATGKVQLPEKMSPLQMFPFKQIVINWLPFPKNLPIAKELVSRKAVDWETERGRFVQILEELAAKPRDGAWGRHPTFGGLTGNQWGVLGYRHTDHHLRQFGV